MRLREKKKKKKENRDKNTVNEIICILQRNKVCVLGFIMGLKVSKGVSRYLVDIWDNIWFIVFAQKQGLCSGFWGFTLFLFWCEIWGFAM